MRRKLLLFLIAILLVAGFMAAPARAASHPSVRQIKREVAALQTHVDVLDQRYDAVNGQISAAEGLIRATATTVASQRRTAEREQSQVAQIAIMLYENGDEESPTALLTAPGAQQVLNQASIAQELSANDARTIRTYYAAEDHLLRLEKAEERQKSGASELSGSARKIRRQMASLTSQEDALTGADPSAVRPVGQTHGVYTGPESTQAEKAVQFAYAQLGCPYVWGGTGPCSAGFDCSGLVMQAWAYAGVSIPRTSEEQWAGLPSVPEQEMAPGDLLIVLGGAHVGMYVGDGKVIAAPQPGQNVQIQSFSGWWQESLDAVVRP